ncbi:olfactory receptor 7E178-like [Erinaceus europaeus]|uniref:Olfactory receptor 7E178-like n=1 Tax=Erinaceus europaeus TaxID=9365 RepID=A0A1S3WFE5_ERIEU|nr:olfactory receptor 7E178-like [Erinaceus europaeus]
MYLISVMGNLLIILAVSSDPHLHTPMYLFLSILSAADVGFISTTIPRMIWDIQTQRRVISYTGCLVQLSFFNYFGCLDSALLAVMAYDRLVAICDPLHYTVTMNPCLCSLLVFLSLFFSLLDSQAHFFMTAHLTFDTKVEIPHFFCDPPQLIRLACEDVSTQMISMYFTSAIFAGLPVSGILYSYRKIISSILKVSSKEGKYKAFSTCGSHLSVVGLFYGIGLGVYLGSVVSHSPRRDAILSVLYTALVPMLNPFIYSLRNRDLKRALKKLINQTDTYLYLKRVWSGVGL